MEAVDALVRADDQRGGGAVASEAAVVDHTGGGVEVPEGRIARSPEGEPGLRRGIGEDEGPAIAAVEPPALHGGYGWGWAIGQRFRVQQGLERTAVLLENDEGTVFVPMHRPPRGAGTVDDRDSTFGDPKQNGLALVAPVVLTVLVRDGQHVTGAVLGGFRLDDVVEGPPASRAPLADLWSRCAASRRASDRSLRGGRSRGRRTRRSYSSASGGWRRRPF